MTNEKFEELEILSRELTEKAIDETDFLLVLEKEYIQNRKNH